MLTLRLVSKAFKTALSDFPGPVKLSHRRKTVRQPRIQSACSSQDGQLVDSNRNRDLEMAKTDVSTLGKIFPCLKDIAITTEREETDLAALSQCIRLSLLYTDPDCHQEEDWGLDPILSDRFCTVDPAQLSSHLKELDLENVRLAPAEALSCPELKKNRFYWARSTPAEVVILLKSLPGLEVSSQRGGLTICSMVLPSPERHKHLLKIFI